MEMTTEQKAARVAEALGMRFENNSDISDWQQLISLVSLLPETVVVSVAALLDERDEHLAECGRLTRVVLDQSVERDALRTELVAEREWRTLYDNAPEGAKQTIWERAIESDAIAPIIASWKDDNERLSAELAAAKEDRDKAWEIIKEELACPECGCATPDESESNECGCDAPRCAYTSGLPLAQEYVRIVEELAAAKAEGERMCGVIRCAIDAVLCEDYDADDVLARLGHAKEQP